MQFTLAAATTITTTLSHTHTHCTRVFYFGLFLQGFFGDLTLGYTGLTLLSPSIDCTIFFFVARRLLHISSLRDWETPLPLLSRHRRRQHCVHIFIHLICYVSHTFSFFLSFYFDTNYVNFSFHARFSRRWQSQPVKVTCVVCLLRWQPTRTQRHRLRLCAELFRFSLCFCCVRRMSHVGDFQHCFGVYTIEQMIVIWQLFGAKALQCWWVGEKASIASFQSGFCCLLLLVFYVSLKVGNSFLNQWYILLKLFCN